MNEEEHKEYKKARNEDRQCPSCGSKIPLDARICPYCGEEIWIWV